MFPRETGLPCDIPQHLGPCRVDESRAHLRHEVGCAGAGIHNGHCAEVHLPNDCPGLGKGVIHDHVQQGLEQGACVVKGVLGQEERKPAGKDERLNVYGSGIQTQARCPCFHDMHTPTQLFGPKVCSRLGSGDRKLYICYV